ncbi:zinc finger CCCH domain-containing protein 14-like [Ylistrum balloti]|uniref:zinc finger CCCH domain-containing protein 14-like n=1 Tax=Ylistrum balloti TaxID=509963 RepID=UPI002905C804|nr:zinc finger CCCH domain-containing protein 14-like [Ylistrum balloti]
MDIGKDISKKIRSAIKAKLIELGAYVDDELPDYIMVMVANKKSQTQMTEDLGLFLSSNTEKFTSWLNGLLDKLQTLGTDKQKSQELEKSETESMNQQNVVKKKKIPEKTDKSVTEKTVTKEKNVTKGPKSFAAKTHKAIKDAKKIKGDEEYVPLLLDKSETDEFSEEFKPEEIKGNKKTSEVSTPSTGQIKTSSKVSPTTKTNPTSTASAEVKPSVKSSGDTTYIRSVMVKPSVTKRLGSVHSRIGQVPKAMAVPVKRAASETQRQVSPVKRKQPMSVVGNVKRKFTEFEEEEYDPYNPAVGSVASVIRVTDRKSSVPAALQANKSLLVKAVSAAEKSVSSKMQEILQERKLYSEKESATVQPFQRTSRSNSGPGDSVPHISKTAGVIPVKSRTGPQKHRSREVASPVAKVAGGVKSRVGVRALPRQSEAHMDMVSPMKVTLSSGFKPKSNLQLVSQASREKRMFRDLRYTIENDTEKVKKVPEVARVPPVMDSRRVQCVPVQEETGVESEEKEETLTNSDEEIFVGKVGITSEDEAEEYESNPDVVADQNVEENGNIIGNTDMSQVVDEDNDDLDLLVEEVEYTTEPVDRGQVDKRRFIQQRTAPEMASNTKFIVTLDGVDHDKYEIAMEKLDEESDMVTQGMAEQSVNVVQRVNPILSNVYKQKLVTPPQVNLVATKKPESRPPAIGPISINLHDTDEEEEMEVEDAEDSPLKKAKMTERCRFWPACVNGNACTYHHPTVPCKMFPQCKFGDRCLFIHPNCKFDAKCTRKDCPYTHASKRGTIATTVIQKIVPVAIPAPGPTPIRPTYMPKMPSTSAVTCKFYPNCKNMSCPFPHPTPCRFGMSCMKKAQCAFYHPALPTKDKLKWTACKTSDDHISERRFDSPAVDKQFPTKIR